MNNAQHRMDASAPLLNPEAALRTLYLEALQLVERLHRRLLDVIKDEFDRNAAATSMQRRRCSCSTLEIRN